MKLTRGEWAVLIFNLSYILISGIYFLAIKNQEFFSYSVSIIIYFLLFIYLHKKINFSLISLWLISIGTLLHLLCGAIKIKGAALYGLHLFTVYSRSDDFYLLRVDQVMHFIGFFIWVFLFYEIVCTLLKPKGNVLFTILIAIMCANGMGAFNEITELSAVTFFKNTEVGGYFNNALDLVFNLIGSIAAGLILYLRDKPKKHLSKSFIKSSFF